jgi:hypothetical protein
MKVAAPGGVGEGLPKPLGMCVPIALPPGPRTSQAQSIRRAPELPAPPPAAVATNVTGQSHWKSVSGSALRGSTRRRSGAPPSARPPLPRTRICQPAAGYRLTDGPARPVQIRPVEVDLTRREALTQFPIPDPYFAPPQLALRGTLGGSAEPARRSQKLEEDFSNGLARWAGGIDDWKLDAAGVRTGALALFTPSLEWSGYELEFLAKFENRSLTWVVRATGLDDYQVLRLVAPGEFSRYAVVGGVAQPTITTPLETTLQRRSAYAVQTVVCGDDYAVTVDGQPVAAWTDPSLPVGGIGFVAAPDDRARLYWVRLTPKEVMNQ